MLKRISALFILVILYTNAVACFASSADRWEWITSDDKRGLFFYTKTLAFGTKEELNKDTYKFYKVIDT